MEDEFSRSDRRNADILCRKAERIADELESDPSGFFKRSPDNPYLTRAVGYNLLFGEAETRPIQANPMAFTAQMLFVHRGLYGGPEAALAGHNQTFYQAFFWVSSHCWPLMCGWDDVWHILGREEWYPDLEFEPSRESCLMEDSRLTGTRAKQSQVKVKSTALVAISVGQGVESQELLQQTIEREEHYSFSSRLPSGHNASIQLKVASTGLTVDYWVEIATDEGLEGLGTKTWKAVREMCPGQILAILLNRNNRVISGVRDEERQQSPIDIWIRRAADDHELPIQVTTLEPGEVYAGLASGSRMTLSYDRAALLAMARKAFERKRNQAASGVHLLVDCGFLIPSSEPFEADVRSLLEGLSLGYESVWLISRVDDRAVCLQGSNPFQLAQPA